MDHKKYGSFLIVGVVGASFLGTQLGAKRSIALNSFKVVYELNAEEPKNSQDSDLAPLANCLITSGISGTLIDCNPCDPFEKIYFDSAVHFQSTQNRITRIPNA